MTCRGDRRSPLVAGTTRKSNAAALRQVQDRRVEGRQERDRTMLILNNDEIETLLSMDSCIEVLNKAYRQLANGEAVNRPRTDLYLPFPETSGVYAFKSMEAGLFDPKVVALRLNSDVIRWEDRGGRIVKDKLPKAPGGKWVGLVLLFSAETGEPLAIFPDGVIQAFRVAASSALAARYMARQDVTHLGIFGSGWRPGPTWRPFARCALLSLVFVPRRRTGSRGRDGRKGFPWNRARTPNRWRKSVSDRPAITRVIPPEWVRPGVHFTCFPRSGDDTIGGPTGSSSIARSRPRTTSPAGRESEAHDPI